MRSTAAAVLTVVKLFAICRLLAAFLIDNESIFSFLSSMNFVHEKTPVFVCVCVFPVLVSISQCTDGAHTCTVDVCYPVILLLLLFTLFLSAMCKKADRAAVFSKKCSLCFLCNLAISQSFVSLLLLPLLLDALVRA